MLAMWVGYRRRLGPVARSPVVEQPPDGGWRHGEERFPADGRQLGGADLGQLDAQPAPVADVRRAEEPFRVGIDHLGLNAVRAAHQMARWPSS